MPADRRDDWPSDMRVPDAVPTDTGLITRAVAMIGSSAIWWRQLAERLENERNEAYVENARLLAETRALRAALTQARDYFGLDAQAFYDRYGDAWWAEEEPARSLGRALAPGASAGEGTT